jgi:hypothetical protein
MTTIEPPRFDDDLKTLLIVCRKVLRTLDPNDPLAAELRRAVDDMGEWLDTVHPAP